MLKKTLSLICFATLSFATSSIAQDQFMADKVVAVVGNSAILYSDLIEMGKQIDQERKKEGYTLDRDVRNEALERLMLQKLLYNQALIDSVEIQMGSIMMNVEDRMRQMTEGLGSVAAVEKEFGKPIYEIKDDMMTLYEEMTYAQTLQEMIQSKVSITPGEVDRFYKRVDKDSLPIIPEQYVYAQITKVPTSTKEAKQRTKENLLELRARIATGTKFEMLARMYSIDHASAVKGGVMGPSPSNTYVTPFKSALEKLRPNQVSEVVETEFGFHIIQLIEKKNNLYLLRHILMKPIFSDSEILETNVLLDSIANQIRIDSITFEIAALKHSDDEHSKQNGGIVSNHEILKAYQVSQASLTSTKIATEDLLADEYRALKKLEIGEVSEAFQTEDQRGNVMSKVVKLIEILPSHPATLKDDYIIIENIALTEKQDNKFGEWLKGKIASMYIRIDSDMDLNSFENKDWIK